MWMCVHMCCKLERALSHYCLVQSIFNVWWNKICLNQSNVQISLLNFSLYYEWFNFYNPLLFYIPQVSPMEITADNINVSSDDPAVSQRTPLDDFPCLGWQQITPGSPSGVPTEIGGSPCGRLWFFFCQLHPKFPRVAEWRPAGDRAAPRRVPADGLIAPDIGRSSGKF